MLLMTVPFWCLALGVVLPYVWSPLSFGERKALGGPDFRTPRVQTARLEGVGARAMGAHANAFEALVVFGVAVVLAHLAGANELWSAVLSVVWLVARFGHGAFYVADIQLLRTGSFAVGFLAALGLIGLAAVA